MIGKKRKAPKNRSQVQPKKRTRRKSSQELERENVKLRKECDQLKIEKKDLKSQVSEVHAKVKRLQKKINALAEDLQTQKCVFEGKLKTLKYELSKRSFTYDCLINNGEEFFELCGLSSKEFDCLIALSLLQIYSFNQIVRRKIAKLILTTENLTEKQNFLQH